MGRKNKWSRDEAREMRRIFPASGLTRQKFAEQEGVAPATLRKHLKRATA